MYTMNRGREEVADRGGKGLRKRRSEEDEMNSPETGVVLRKKRRGEDAMNSSEKGEVQRKRRRVEEAMNSPELGEVQRKRRREEDAMNSPETGVVLRKKRRGEGAMISSETGEVQRKRRRVEEAMNSPERDEVLRKRSREELAEPADESRKQTRFSEEPANKSRKKVRFFKEPGRILQRAWKKIRFFKEPADESRKKVRFFKEPGRILQRAWKKIRFFKEPADESRKKVRFFEEPADGSRKKIRFLEEPADESKKKTGFFEEPAKESRDQTGFFEEPAQKSRKRVRFFKEPVDESRKKIRFSEEPAAKSRKKVRFFKETDNESRKKTPKIDETGVCGMTSVHREEQACTPTKHAPDSLGPESFIFHKILGEGGFGKVVLATHRDSSLLVAIKIVRKERVIEHPATILTERQVMEIVGSNRFFTHTYATFQTEDHLFYVMEFLSGGDLWNWFCTKVKCDLNSLRLLAAELLCGLQFLHSRGVAHRDLKLRNFLLDCAGHVKFADFGEAATNLFGSRTETTTVGTEMFRAPEIILGIPHDKTVDYFSLGIVLFEIAFRYHPFRVPDVRNSICYDLPKYPEGADPDLVAFLNKLLCKDQQKRKKAIANIRDDPFFQGINWEEVKAGETPPPFFVRRVGCRKMTRQTIELEELTKTETRIPLAKQKLFDGFSFVNNTWSAMQRLNKGQKNIRL